LGRVPRFPQSTGIPRLGEGAIGAIALALAFVAGATTVATAARSSRPYTTVPGPSRDDARFVLTYRGTGAFRTTYHSTPPNPGGKADTNDAHDSSTQKWKLRFSRAVAIPPCQPGADPSTDPCTAIAGVDGATGPTTVTGRVRHTHKDGLYRQLDMKESCRFGKSTAARRQVTASVSMTYDPASQTIGVTARNPVATALSLAPGGCRHGDSLDGLADFYAPPGFSFDTAYDADRWFTSQTVAIPVAAFHRSASIAIPLADTATGTPPRHCAVQNPSFERCTTGGSWTGVLTLTRKP
jgi:hypothetical protein